MATSPPAARPSLYFDAAGVEKLRQRAATTHRRYFDALQRWVDAHLDRQPLRGINAGFVRHSSEVYFEETFSFLSNVMLAYLVTGEERYADVARAWLRALCTYPLTMGGAYSVGPCIAALAHGYDWLAGVLPADERDAIRAQLISLVRSAYECTLEPGKAWWYGCYLHHDFWIPVAGFGTGALVLVDDVPEAQQWLQQAAAELGRALDLLGDDGAWHEGAADWVYALVLPLLFADALRRRGGESFYDRTWLRNTWRFRLYSWLPDDTYVYLNDSFRSGRYNILGSASCHVLRRLAGEYRNGYLQWLADRDERFDSGEQHPGVYRSPYTWRGNQSYAGAAMHMLAWNLLWYDPAVEAQPPDDLPPAHYFENQGLLVARTGWDEGASVVTFSCGPIGGHAARRAIAAGEEKLVRGATHAHAQANSFTLFTRGHYVVVPPGYGRAASRFQNTVAINGGGQVWHPLRAGAMLAVETTANYVYAVGDATACYPEEAGIRRYLRHLLFLPPHFLVTCDLIEGGGFPSGLGRNYAWQLHSDPAETVPSIAGSRLRFAPVDGASAVEAHLLLPELFGWLEARYRDADGTPLLDETAALLNFQVPNPAAFLAVFALTDRALATPVERVLGGHVVGAIIGGAADPLVVAFRRGQGDAPLEYDVEPARAARHMVAGLVPGRAHDVGATLAPRAHRWPEAALRTAEENYVSRITVSPGGAQASTAAGLLVFGA
jgi:hypothetical protein